MHKKQKKLGVSIFSLALLLAGCSNGTLTSDSSSSDGAVTDSSSSITNPDSSSSSSSEVFVKTEALTEAMFAKIKEGYAAEFFSSTIYEGSTPSVRIRDVEVDVYNYAFREYTAIANEGASYTRGSTSKDCHYQVNPAEMDEEYPMLYDTGLSIGNNVIYTPVIGRDPLTFKEIHLTWEEGYYSNVFANLSVTNFTRVGDENKFALDLANYDLANAGVYNMLAMQLYGELVAGDIEYFYLLTNGDKIVGFELKFETYLSYESMVSKSSTGTFKDFGDDVVDLLKPLEGLTKDAEFDNAIASLKQYNYHVEHEQGGYDYTSGNFVGRGKFVGDAYNGEELNYDYYTSGNKKYMNYTYYDAEDEEGAYIQGATKIGDKFYNDVGYTGTVKEILPAFDISSEMFVKSNESTATKLIYDLNKDIKISLENDNSNYSSFDSDGYCDRTVYLRVTIDKEAGTISFHNETSKQENVGLIEDVIYSNIGGVSELVTATNISDNCDDIKWKELLSNNEVAYSEITTSIPESVLETLPTFGGRYAVVYFDSGILFTTTYSQEENSQLLAEYQEKLLAAGFTAQPIENEDEIPTYTLEFTKGPRNYVLSISLATWWNANYNQGQFQVHTSVS